MDKFGSVTCYSRAYLTLNKRRVANSLRIAFGTQITCQYCKTTGVVCKGKQKTKTKLNFFLLQMSGRCVCKPAILGTKCETCPDGSPVTYTGCKGCKNNFLLLL